MPRLQYWNSSVLTGMRSLRPPQVQRHRPHHQGQGPRLRSDQHRQGRRERPLHRREPDLRPLRLRPRHGRERRLHQQAHPEGWFPQECLERTAIDCLGRGSSYPGMACARAGKTDRDQEYRIRNERGTRRLLHGYLRPSLSHVGFYGVTIDGHSVSIR